MRAEDLWIKQYCIHLLLIMDKSEYINPEEVLYTVMWCSTVVFIIHSVSPFFQITFFIHDYPAYKFLFQILLQLFFLCIPSYLSISPYHLIITF